MKAVNTGAVCLIHCLLAPKYIPPKIGADSPRGLLRIRRTRIANIGIGVFPSPPVEYVGTTAALADKECVRQPVGHVNKACLPIAKRFASGDIVFGFAPCAETDTAQIERRKSRGDTNSANRLVVAPGRRNAADLWVIVTKYFRDQMVRIRRRRTDEDWYVTVERCLIIWIRRGQFPVDRTSNRRFL